MFRISLLGDLPQDLANPRAMSRHLLAETTVVEVRTVEVPVLAAGDTVEVDGNVYRIQGERVRDSERLVWTAELRPA